MKWWPSPVSGAGAGFRNDCNNWPQKRARFFPLAQRKRRPLTLCSELGEVKLIVDYGQDRATGEWWGPVRRAWGLGPHQQITPAWAEKLTFTVTATGSYEEAAAVAEQIHSSRFATMA